MTTSNHSDSILKRRSILTFILISFICSIALVSIANAQDFTSISQPPDFTVKQNENASITWEVSISSVTTPTYDVYRNGIAYISDFDWVLEGTTGEITIHIETDNLGLFNYSITVKDGAGHEISDEVFVTIEGRTGLGEWWTAKSGWVYVVFGTVLVGSMVAMALMRRKGFRKSGSMISN